MTSGPLAKIIMSMRIVTHYDPPPIPTRNCDWSAYDDLTYDGEESDPVGYGETELEAIQNLLEIMEMRMQ